MSRGEHESVEALRQLEVALTRERDLVRVLTGDMKNAEERLLRSEKMAILGRLTAGIAHEMNTPLAAARAALTELGHLLAEYDASIGDPDITEDDQHAIGSEMKSLLSIANGSTEKAAAFVRGIKTQIRDVEQDDRLVFDAVKVIDEALLLLGHDFRARRCTVQFEHRSPPVQLLGVPGRLAQVVNNLVNNAVDASVKMGSDRIVRLELSANDAGVELSVVDHGSGIKQELLTRIFEPMFTTKPFGEGTGLGLSIVHDVVVNEFGGTIDVSSREGEGTTFVVRFPRL